MISSSLLIVHVTEMTSPGSHSLRVMEPTEY